MKDEAGGIDAALIGSPARPMPADVRAVLFARDKRLFLSVTPIRRKNRLIIEVSALTPSLGRKPIAQRLKREVRLLGPRGLEELPVRHQGRRHDGRRVPPVPRAVAFGSAQAT